MSRPQLAVAFVTSLAALAAPCLAHAGEPAATPDGVRERLETPPAPSAASGPSVAAEAAPARMQLVLSGDLGLAAIEGQLGARYRWFEVDVGLRGRHDASEKFGGVKVLVHPEGPMVPFAYAQIGQWTTTVITDGTPLAVDHRDASGLMLGGGFGLEVPMGRVATLSLHFGIDDDVGNGEHSHQVDAGVGFGLRL